MIRAMWLLSMTLAGGVASAASSQAPVDFSGRWSVESTAPATPPPAPAAVRGDMGSGWGTTMAITQGANQLVVEPTVFSTYDLQPQPRYVYALDGSETRNTAMMGRGLQVQTSRAAWDGSSLRITTVHTLADPVSSQPLTMDVTQRLSLTSPTTLVVEVTRGAVLGGRSSTTRVVYTKG